MLRCAFCKQEFVELNKQVPEVTAAIEKHIRAAHPNNWLHFNAGDAWVIRITDKQ